MATSWEPAALKAQLRLTSQRLGQLQAKNDSNGNIIRKDIATLLQQGNVGMARAKAQRLIEEDILGDLLEQIEMQIGALLEHFTDLEHHVSPSPVVIEAASSIIYAGPEIQSKDLDMVRMSLIRRLGPDITRSAIGNRDNHVSRGVLRTLSSPTPSAAQLDGYLQNIARDYGITWSAGLRRQDIVNLLSEMLDPQASPTVDVHRLRALCSRGLPDEPGWLRPRVWKLLFNILPPVKALWKSEMNKQRDSYYDLVQRLLTPFLTLPPPTYPLGRLDNNLLTVYKKLSHVSSAQFHFLEEEMEASTPMDNTVSNGVESGCAGILDLRLGSLRSKESMEESSVIPEIRLEMDNTPSISVSQDEIGGSATLLPSKIYHFGNAHSKHCSVLLRLLYLHCAINPGNLSQHTPTWLVTLYSALVQEADLDELSHVEADTFWLFEAMVGEFSELQDEETTNLWTSRFSNQLAWADPELSEYMREGGLDPSMPHYSNRWLTSLLTQTLPLSVVLPVWDVLFSCDMRDRDTNPKITCLVDICTSMLICSRKAITRSRNIGKGPSLWHEDRRAGAVSSMSIGEDDGDGFLEAVSILQKYPAEAAGGVDRILQTNFDLVQRRMKETEHKQDKQGFGARIKDTMWKGFSAQAYTNQSATRSHETYDTNERTDDGNETETPLTKASSRLTAHLASTVWRGITNQTAMDPPLTPLSPRSPEASLPNSPRIASRDNAKDLPSVTDTSGIWGYAEKFRGSDTVATIAKVSSNWRAKAFISSWGHGGTNSTPLLQSGSQQSPKVSKEVEVPVHRARLAPMQGNSPYSPPARPAHFRPPRDSFILPASPVLSNTMEESPSDRLVDRTKKFLSLNRPAQRTSMKSGPRPLLLNSSPILNTPARVGTSELNQWSDVYSARGHVARDSQSSVSSLSPSDVLGRPLISSRSDWDSDSGSSRLVSLNRRSISPMAPMSRISQSSPKAIPGTPSDRGLRSPLSSDWYMHNGTASAIDEREFPDPSLKTNYASDSSLLDQTRQISRVRSKRHSSRPSNLNLSHLRSGPSPEVKIANASNLTVDWPTEEHDLLTTPRAAGFESDGFHPVSIASRSPKRPRKVSSGDSEGQRKGSIDDPEPRPRKTSSSRRTRKISFENKDLARRSRDSGAEEGDDEGYDELLSAYESEEATERF